jgi:tetratricopeptide (TPR) repeat protein
MGSLAQEVMDAGAPAVVAMRYSVFDDTAAAFMTDLYRRLLAGGTVGEAVSFGRKQLHAQTREIRDWTVPLIFQAADFALFRKPKKGELNLALQSGALEIEGLPPRPDAGFFGRDETLLALDRAFDRQSIVLLHAYAGSGKTSAAAEFARWYKETGGIEGPVFFTSFEHKTTLDRVLDQVGQAFGKALERQRVHWLTLEAADRRRVALAVLQQVPVFWIWDNVEPVAGFPKGTESQWSGDEQRELADFLRAAPETKARFLLTSRRDEREWLHDLPARIELPPMQFHERLELARALAEKRGHRLTDVEDWRPLLEFTQGNPLTITVLVGQALRDRLRTRAQIEAFVERLRRGQAAFHDESSEGRTRSLAASLNYGFEHAFNETERGQLALLYLFQGFVDVEALMTMGSAEADWCLPEVRGLTRERGVRLLDRAAEIGLLTAHGDGYYSIHPAVPWFLREQFERRGADASQAAFRSYVEAIGELGSYYTRRYVNGNAAVIPALRAEEQNLLYARALARQNRWRHRVISAMQALQQLYAYTGRTGEWRHLVEEIVPEFVDPATGGPLPGCNEHWTFVSEYRVNLATRARDWALAERLQRQDIEWNRQQALAGDRASQRMLAAALGQLGRIQADTGAAECVDNLREAFEIATSVDDRPLASAVALNLGNAYLSAPDLDRAEQWYRKSLDLRAAGDRLGRARAIGQLGHVEYERFSKDREDRKPEGEALTRLNSAARLYHEALKLTPADAIRELAALHNQLGNICYDGADPNRALGHYQKSIGYKEAAGDTYGAAETRENIAILLMHLERFSDAVAYAQAALRDFHACGAADRVQRTLDLIADLEKARGASA